MLCSPCPAVAVPLLRTLSPGCAVPLPRTKGHIVQAVP